MKRSLSLINDKAITGIADLRDESDKDGLRIVIDLKKGQIPEVIINQLIQVSAIYRSRSVATCWPWIMVVRAS